MDVATSSVVRANTSRHKKQKIKAELTIVGGAGHVGLPLALAFAGKGLKVLIYDLNQKALDNISNGKLPAIEHGAGSLLQTVLERNLLQLSSNVGDIPESGSIIITIGTPVDEFLNPLHTSFKACINGLLPYLSKEHLIILRSTVYPGTTDWLGGYLKSKKCQSKLAFCPERIVQGYAIKELPIVPQIISGVTIEAAAAAANLFSFISPEILRVKPLEAEFAKLFTNAYRYIQFAASNQFYTIADSAGADYASIVNAMTHGYERMKDFPGAGFAAGPCLFKDTMQLSAFAQNQFSIGHAAMLTNEGLPLYVIEKMRRTWDDLSDKTVGLLGMAFKPEVDDIRSSLSYKVKKLLSMYARQVLTTDPYATGIDILPVKEVIERSDILVLCTPHKCYKKVDLQSKPIIDVWKKNNLHEN